MGTKSVISVYCASVKLELPTVGGVFPHKLMLVRPVQPWNAYSLMLVTLLPIVTEVNVVFL